MDKYKNKYRVPTARAQWWDYGRNGAYFITICTKNRVHYFGEGNNGRIALSNLGEVANILWHEIPNHAPFVELGDFIVMPNHIHGILILNKPDIRDGNGNGNVNGNGNGNVETRLIASLQQPHHQSPPPTEKSNAGGFSENKNPMIHENVSRIIRWYKGRCSFELRKINAHFEWQSRFYDHIIRNDSEYQRISDYIVNNPMNWCTDKFF